MRKFSGCHPRRRLDAIGSSGPGQLRAVTVHKDETRCSPARTAATKDPRPLAARRGRADAGTVREALVAGHGQRDQHNTVWTSIFEPLSHSAP